MRHIFTIVILVLAQIMLAGNPGNTKKLKATLQREPYSKSEIKTVTIVLCDLTQSMVIRDSKKKVIDSTVLQKIKNDAARIFSEADFGTELYYLGIDNMDYNTELFHQSKIAKSGKKAEIDRYNYENEVVTPQLIREAIAKTFNPTKYDKTCITHALNNVYGKFAEWPAGTKFRLIILSDMVEACDNSPLGYLNMESTSKVAKTQKTLDSCSIKIVYDLYALGVEVFMVYESKNERYNISMDNMQALWTKIFSHYGYKKSSDLHFGNVFPERLIRRR